MVVVFYRGNGLHGNYHSFTAVKIPRGNPEESPATNRAALLSFCHNKSSSFSKPKSGHAPRSFKGITGALHFTSSSSSSALSVSRIDEDAFLQE